MRALYCGAGRKAKRSRAVVLLLLLPAPCAADGGWDQFVRDVQLGWDNSFKVRWEELLRRPHDSELRNLLDGWSAAPGFTQPLNAAGQPGAGGNGSRVSSSPTANLNLRYEPVQSWFASLTVYKYLDERRRQPWNPDFTYSFGFDDYRPYTFGLFYSNYSNSRFSTKPGVKPTGFGHGRKLEAIGRARVPVSGVGQVLHGCDPLRIRRRKAAALGSRLHVWLRLLRFPLRKAL